MGRQSKVETPGISAGNITALADLTESICHRAAAHKKKLRSEK